MKNSPSIELAFNRVKTLAEESSQRGDYHAGAVLMDKSGDILLEARNDVATNEPHGVQAEVRLLHDYFSERARGERKLPNIDECFLVTLCEPSVAAPQIVTAGVGKCYYAIDDAFASLSKAGLYTNSAGAEVFQRLEQEQEFLTEITAKVDAARQRVFQEKQKYGAALPEVKKFSEQARHLLGVIEGNSYSQNNFLAQDARQFTSNNSLATFLSDSGKLKSMQISNENVVLAFDQEGTLLAGFRDDCNANPINTAMMQAVDYFHETYRLAGGQGAMAKNEESLRVEGAREKVPHARDVVFLSLMEPILMEGARLSQPANKNCLFQEPREQGIITSGAMSNIPPLYKKKGLNFAIRSTSEELAAGKLSIMPETSPRSSNAVSLAQRDQAAQASHS